ncbi:MAG: hypothetical protein ABJA67_06725 [Chthonomonadales bacterium]
MNSEVRLLLADIASGSHSHQSIRERSCAALLGDVWHGQFWGMDVEIDYLKSTRVFATCNCNAIEAEHEVTGANKAVDVQQSDLQEMATAVVDPSEAEPDEYTWNPTCRECKKFLTSGAFDLEQQGKLMPICIVCQSARKDVLDNHTCTSVENAQAVAVAITQIKRRPKTDHTRHCVGCKQLKTVDQFKKIGGGWKAACFECEASHIGQPEAGPIIERPTMPPTVDDIAGHCRRCVRHMEIVLRKGEPIKDLPFYMDMYGITRAQVRECVDEAMVNVKRLNV